MAARTVDRGPIAQTLHDALMLIGDEKGWCRDGDAATASGNWVSVENPLAVRFCAWGAVNAVAPGKRARQTAVALVNEYAVGHLEDPWVDITVVNDEPHHGHAAVISILSDALDFAEQEGM